MGQWHSVFPVKYGRTSFLKNAFYDRKGTNFPEKFMAEVPDRGLMIRSCQGEGGVRGEGPQILISVYLKTVNLNIFRNYGGIKT